MVCSFSKQFYQHNNTIQSMCLVDSTHTPELCCYKGSQLYSQGTLQFPVSGWPLPKSYLGFMWCSQTLTLHCSFGNSFTLLPAKWLLEMPFFGFFLTLFYQWYLFLVLSLLRSTLDTCEVKEYWLIFWTADGFTDLDAFVARHLDHFWGSWRQRMVSYPSSRSGLA